MPRAEREEGELTIEVAELYPPQGQWTEGDYFSLPETNRLVELSEGRLIIPPHPTYTHQTVLQNLFLRLNAFVEERGQLDRSEKFYEYAKAGVGEYWLVDPDERTIEVYILREGSYTLLGKHPASEGEIARSDLLSGFQVRVDEVLEQAGIR